MTTEQYQQPGSALAVSGQWDGYMTGLEDFTAEDLKLARLVIDQKAGTFKDTLSGAEYPAVHAITLGVVKQRVMWKAAVEEESMPLCKSTDNHNGYPTTWDKPQNNFPWQAAGWQPSDFPKDDLGRVVLPCDSCRFKEWKSHPDGKKPWCSMQHAVPLLYSEVGGEPFAQAVFTFQRSSLPSSQAYFAGFMQKGMPAFSSVCEITLSKQKRGQNDYYVPILRVLRPTSQVDWPKYAEDYMTMRDFLTRPPTTRDENGEVVAASLASNNVIQAQATNPAFSNDTWVPTAAPQQAPVVQPQAPVVVSPIATPVQQPVQQAYIPMQVTPQQAQQMQQPVQPVASFVQPVQAQVIPQVAAPVAADDDLPF